MHMLDIFKQFDKVRVDGWSVAVDEDLSPLGKFAEFLPSFFVGWDCSALITFIYESLLYITYMI